MFFMFDNTTKTSPKKIFTVKVAFSKICVSNNLSGPKEMILYFLQ